MACSSSRRVGQYQDVGSLTEEWVTIKQFRGVAPKAEGLHPVCSFLRGRDGRAKTKSRFYPGTRGPPVHAAKRAGNASVRSARQRAAIFRWPITRPLPPLIPTTDPIAASLETARKRRYSPCCTARSATRSSAPTSTALPRLRLRLPRGHPPGKPPFDGLASRVVFAAMIVLTAVTTLFLYFWWLLRVNARSRLFND